MKTIKSIIVLVILSCNLLYGDYVGMDIKKFISIVAMQNYINIVIDKNIDKDFDFYINQDIPQQTNIDVLRDVLDSNGYLLEKKKDYYIVTDKQDKLINKITIFNIKHADTQKVTEKINEVLKSYFKSVKNVNVKSNKNTLAPTEEIKHNEVVTENEKVEESYNFKVIALDNKNIALTYKDQFVPDVVQNLINKIDVQPKRAVVNIKIYEVNTDALRELGSQLGVLGGSNTDSVKGLVNLNTNPLITIEDIITPGKSFLALTGVVKALESKGDAKLLSQPKILVYEGKSSKYVEGRTYPIEQDQTTVQNNATTTSKTIKNVDTGMILNLTFVEERSGMLYMDLSLNINDVLDYTKNQIITNKRELVNNLLIKPGEVIGLAGVNNSQNNNKVSGIPLLSWIPYIGRLFQLETTSKKDSSIVIELQAELI
jgi:type II secretory pathway component GspD/PulD (secretin)